MAANFGGLVMRQRRLVAAGILIIATALGICSPARAQDAAAKKSLTVEQIFGSPALSGQLTRGIAWSPDDRRLSFLVATGTGKSAKTELWEMDTKSGERHLLVAADKLAAALQPSNAPASQATGIARRPAAQYVWAPDGNSLLFVGPTSLTWFDLKTQTAKSLVQGDDPISDAKISPDGKWASYVLDYNLWTVSTAGGEPRSLTKGGREELHEGQLDWVYPEELQIGTAYWWAPDSSSIAYLEMDERPVTKYPIQNSLGEVGETEWERYPAAGSANPIVKVFVVDVNGGSPQLMDTGNNTDIYIARVNWMPDSRTVAIQRLNRAQDTLELLAADAKTGTSRVILRDTDKYWINTSDDLKFLRDGKRFIWSSERTGYRHLYLYDLEGKQIAQLTSGDWEVIGLSGVDEEAGTVYFTATEKSPLERHLYRVGLDGKGFKRVTQEAGTHDINMSMNGRLYVDTYSNVMQPPRQDVFHGDGIRIAALNENAVPQLAEFAMSPVEFLSVKTHDNVMLNAMMIKPVGFDPSRKYPVLIYTYGGPHAQVVRNAWGGATFLWHELMAEKGFVIFAMDNRGSSGRGHVFEEPIHYRLGAQELSDQRDGVRYLDSLPYVDAARIGIWGASYGGHMTLHAVFRNPGEFKVGFAASPVSDWHLYDTIYTERYLGQPKERIEEYEESSPVKTAGQLKGKLLIAAGTGDDNVHFANTLEVIDELIAAGKYAEVAVFPGRGHGISDPAARVVLFKRVTEFFIENLGGGAGKPAVQ
jgi:dipeptidyl-peptidase 4